MNDVRKGRMKGKFRNRRGKIKEMESEEGN